MLAPTVELRPYQVDSVERMHENPCMVLAVVMGGGKTVISLAAIEEKIVAGEMSRALIVVPSTLKYQWQQEIQKFTNTMSLVIDGSPARRQILYEEAHRYPYVIINYEAVVNDWKVVRKLRFDAMILDEATYIKGFSSKRSRAVKSLGTKARLRFALTGQPVENKPEDLFSIMEFVDDEVLGSFEKFDHAFIVRDFYGKPLRYINLPLLNKLMRPSMIRYSREDIKDQLPDVVESTVPIELSRAEARLYTNIADRLLDRMDELSDQYGSEFSLTANYGRDEDHAMMRAQGEVMSMLLALRLVCDDSRLLLQSAMHYDVREKNDQGRATGPGTGSKFAWDLMQEGVLVNLPASTKLKALCAHGANKQPGLITEALLSDPAAKVVVFSGFKGMLRFIQQETSGLTGSVIYDGDMNARQKDRAKRQFSTDPDTRLFLSSDAGGYGVNLSEANYLISADLPWSTGKFDQRQSRIIRLSTEFDHVNLLATIAKGSVEERIHAMLTEKSGVAGAFVDAKYDKLGKYDITLSSLTEFLREAVV